MIDRESTVPTQVARSAVLFSGLLVVLVLGTNMISLAMSFSPVFRESPEIYESGMNGSISLPDLPENIDEFLIEIPENITEGKPFRINIRMMDEKVPGLPLYLELRGEDGRRSDFDLFDRIQNERWSAYTIIFGNLNHGSYTLSIGYLFRDQRYSIGTFNESFEIDKATEPFPLLFLNDSLEAGDLLRVGINEPADATGMDLRLKDGRILPLEIMTNGSFILDPMRYNLSGWNELDIILNKVGGESKEYGPYLVNFDSNFSALSNSVELEIELPFREFDELYGQEPGKIFLDPDSEIPELLTSTYYHVSFKMNFSRADPPGDVPLPFPYLIVEGRSILLRPSMDGKYFTGVIRTPGSYNDHPDDGLIVRMKGMEMNQTLFEKDLHLKDRQSPGLIFDPDPFREPFTAMNGTIVRIQEGWELVTYRDFPRSPSVSVDGSDQEMKRSVVDGDTGDLIRYTSSDLSSRGLRGQVIDLEVRAEFRMQVTISFIFFAFPFPLKGIMVPVWFTLISIAITASLLFLAWRSTRDIAFGISEKKGNRHILNYDNDLFSLSTTYMGALFFSWVVVIMFQLMEQPTPVPSILSDETPIWIRMILLADASVWEEIVSRVLFIGVPLLFMQPSRKWNLGRFKVLLGGSGKFGTAEIVLILISSSFFGLAHIGWGPWKVLPTFVTGALFGYLYIKTGLHAAIAMHFLFDYDGFIYDLLDYPDIQLFSVYYFAFLFGGFFLARIILRFLKHVTARTGRKIERNWILILHSILSLLVVLYSLIMSEMNGYTIFLAVVPLLNGAAMLFEKADVSWIPEILVLCSSFISLILAPIGLVWIIHQPDGRKRDVDTLEMIPS
jgi:hypothetical protein